MKPAPDGEGAGRAALQLLQRSEGALEGWLRRKVPLPEDRADVMQEIRLAVAKRPAALLAADEPEAWLRRVAARRWADLLKAKARRGREEPIEELDLSRMSRTVSSKVGWKRLFERCGDDLPSDDCREILVLWHKHGLQPDEIARVLNERGRRNTRGGSYTPTIVQQRLRRDIVPCLKKLLHEPQRL